MMSQQHVSGVLTQNIFIVAQQVPCSILQVFFSSFYDSSFFLLEATDMTVFGSCHYD